MTDAKPSKTAKKREYLELQSLGEQLIGLTDEQLATIDTDERLLEQIAIARKIRSHGALRRQKQLIGKIMRNVDPQPIREALARLADSDREAKTAFRQSEHWRDRIVTEGRPALDAFTTATGKENSLLSGYLRDYAATPDNQRRRRIRRQIFQEIHRRLVGGASAPKGGNRG